MVTTNLNPLDLILLATFTGIGTALGNRIFNWFERRGKTWKEKIRGLTKKDINFL